MNKNHYVFLTLLMLFLASCSNVDQDLTSPTSNEAEEGNKLEFFSSCDVASLKTPLNQYLTSILRSCDSETINLDEYDFSDATCVQNNTDGYCVISVRNVLDSTNYMVFRKDDQVGVTSFMQISAEDLAPNKKRVSIAGAEGEVLLSGILDAEKELYTIDYKNVSIYTDLRASAAHYGCTAAFWAAGSAVSIPLGMVNPIVGLVVGFGYTMLSDWACSHIE